MPGLAPHRLQAIFILVVSFIIFLPTQPEAVVTEEWMAQYAGSGDPHDKACDIGMDASSNIYITGTTGAIFSDDDFSTVSYDSSGTLRWSASYDSGSGNDDSAVAMVVDPPGNVYVTGLSKGIGTGDDYVTIKYDRDGNQLWVARYNGSSNNDDNAVDISVDLYGNSYVTGHSYDTGKGYDFATIKYDNDGNQLWVARYGAGSRNEYATAVRVDAAGYVYVTGHDSRYEVVSGDFITLKYDGAGNLVWVRRYNGPGSTPDYTTGMTIDGNNNVYIIGYSGEGVYLDATDYVTLKYDKNGNEQWARTYDAAGYTDIPRDIAVDISGNVYVTGSSEAASDDSGMVTIKYDSAGNLLWIDRVDPFDNDVARSLTVDHWGNAYVTGYHGRSTMIYKTIKYNTDGARQWIRTFLDPADGKDHAYAVAVDSSGNVYVTGEAEGSILAPDMLTIKYASDGTELWAIRYNSPISKGEDRGRAIVADAAGYVYVAGHSEGRSTGKDFFTIKYDSDGTTIWEARYDSPASVDDEARSITVDDLGNVYVTGEYDAWSFHEEYLTLKYDSAGNLLWSALYNSAFDGRDRAEAIAVDDGGNVYVIGTSTGPGTSEDIALVKYDSDGSQLWVVRYAGPSTSNDVVGNLVLDPLGNVYVTGAIDNGSTNYDYITLKYDTGGTLVWEVTYDGVTNHDLARDIILDSAGNVYVTGGSTNSYSFYDLTTIRYDASGTELWVQRHRRPPNYDVWGSSILVDDSFNVYVTGTAEIFRTDEDFVTLKYDKDGVEQWVSYYDGPGNSFDSPYSIARDSSGNVYSGGHSTGVGTSFDYTVIKYNDAGIEQWVWRYDGPAHSADFLYGMVLDSPGNIYVTGVSRYPVSGDDCLTVKLSDAVPVPVFPQHWSKYIVLVLLSLVLSFQWEHGRFAIFPDNSP